MEKIEEIWKDIPKWEGKYQASNSGRIKSLPKTVTLHHGGVYTTSERILKPRTSKEGYCFVALFNGETRKDIQIHILIARTFIDNPYNKKEVNHIDGVKSNNIVGNLEWATHAENVKHGYKSGLYDGKSQNVQCLCTGRKMKVPEAAKELGLEKQSLYAMLRGDKNNWSQFIYA